MIRSSSRRLAICLSVLAALVATSALSARAETYPTRPIRLIVPFQPGSSSDVIARIVSQRLAERLGQQIVVDNRVGASATLGSEAVARAERTVVEVIAGGLAEPAPVVTS